MDKFEKMLESRLMDIEDGIDDGVCGGCLYGDVAAILEEYRQFLKNNRPFSFDGNRQGETRTSEDLDQVLDAARADIEADDAEVCRLCNNPDYQEYSTCKKDCTKCNSGCNY